MKHTRLPIILFALTIFSQFAPAQAVSSGPASYYRLRISFNTKSDWASLETTDPRVLISRQISVQGSPQIYTMSTGQVMIGQPISSAQAGNAVGVLVDYAIDPTNLASNPIAFKIRGGNINNSWVAMWNVAATGNTFFQLFDTLGLPGSGSWGFSLNSAALLALPPTQVASWQTPALRKMAWAYYYGWYPYLSNWTSPMLKDYPLTLYTSGDTSAMQRQITQAKSAGLDGFVASWASGFWTDTYFRPLLDTAQAQNFAITPLLEIMDANGNPLPPSVLVTWLTALLTNYGSHPAFYKVGGRPVVYIWSTGSVPLATWASIFAQVRAKGLDANFLSMGVDWNDLSVFDGMHLYGYHGNEIASIFPTLKPQVKYYHLVADVWAPTRAKIWAPGVAPGYDDTLVPGRTGAVQPRNNGSYYQSQWDILNQANPDWVALTSWNEFYENTQIEPSVNYGYQYGGLTLFNVNRWKAQ